MGTEFAAMDDIESLENTIAWRLRCFDADPADVASANAVRVLEALVADLRQRDHAEAWAALGAMLNWLGESD